MTAGILLAALFLAFASFCALQVGQTIRDRDSIPDAIARIIVLVLLFAALAFAGVKYVVPLLDPVL